MHGDKSQTVSQQSALIKQLTNKFESQVSAPRKTKQLTQPLSNLARVEG